MRGAAAGWPAVASWRLGALVRREALGAIRLLRSTVRIAPSFEFTFCELALASALPCRLRHPLPNCLPSIPPPLPPHPPLPLLPPSPPLPPATTSAAWWIVMHDDGACGQREREPHRRRVGAAPAGPPPQPPHSATLRLARRSSSSTHGAAPPRLRTPPAARAPRLIRSSLARRSRNASLGHSGVLRQRDRERGAVAAADRPRALICSGDRGDGDGVGELALLLLVRAARPVAAGACGDAGLRHQTRADHVLHRGREEDFAVARLTAAGRLSLGLRHDEFAHGLGGGAGAGAGVGGGRQAAETASRRGADEERWCLVRTGTTKGHTG